MRNAHIKSKTPTFRSGYEKRAYAYLVALHKTKVVEYEQRKIWYTKTVYKGKCLSCGSAAVIKASLYIPDFYIEGVDGATWVEAKGLFTSADRTKILEVLDDPDTPIRRENFMLLFQRDNWLTKKHLKRYSDWCKDNRIKFVVKDLVCRK